jgi:Iron-containing redox enzyme
VPSASARLQRKVELILPAFRAPARLLFEHPRARELFAPYLAAGSYVSLVMVPLMQLALERSRALAPTDPVAAGLVDYLERHIVEEMHGDEPGDGSLEDLDALGVDTGELRARPLPEQVAALIGTQYFRILHAHPVAVLGLLWLEAYPPQTAAVQRLMERTGLPPDGFRQLFLHAEVDVRHGAELHELVDALPLEPRHEQLIGLSALEAMSFLIDVWLEVLGDDGASPPAERWNAPLRATS